jgi:hypothetical protein
LAFGWPLVGLWLAFGWPLVGWHILKFIFAGYTGSKNPVGQT